jgi:ATP-binding protein involved in chromosome partitioning
VTDIFKKGGGERTAQELECAFLGNIPLDPAIAIAGDEGLPIVVREPDGSHGASFQAIARAVVEASVEETPRVSIQ